MKAKVVKLTVHRNTLAKRQERDRAAALLARARKSAQLDGGLGGFALVVWNEAGEPTAWWDTGKLPPWSLPDFARRVLENQQDRESDQQSDEVS